MKLKELISVISKTELVNIRVDIDGLKFGAKVYKGMLKNDSPFLEMDVKNIYVYNREITANLYKTECEN